MHARSRFSLAAATLAVALAATVVPAATAVATSTNTALASARTATAAFHDPATAKAAGYLPSNECVAVPGLGVMGQHWVNPKYFTTDASTLPPRIRRHCSTYRARPVPASSPSSTSCSTRARRQRRTRTRSTRTDRSSSASTSTASWPATPPACPRTGTCTCGPGSTTRTGCSPSSTPHPRSAADRTRPGHDAHLSGLLRGVRGCDSTAGVG